MGPLISQRNNQQPRVPRKSKLGLPERVNRGQIGCGSASVFRHRFACSLVDDSSSIDDVDETPRETACEPVSSAVGESEEPDGDDRRLAEASRDVATLWKVTFDDSLIQRGLPKERLVFGHHRGCYFKLVTD